MKLAKLSLAAIVVGGLVSSSIAADTLEDAFKNGKVSGELKAWYLSQDFETTSTYQGKGAIEIPIVGVTLGYVTDSFNGFRLGLTTQTSANPGISEDAKNSTTYQREEYAGGTVLSEAYLSYKLSNTEVKVGRQFIATPLVSGSGTRFMRESFQGATLVNTDLPQTTVWAGWIDKFQGRTSSVEGDPAGNPGTFENRAVFLGSGAGASTAVATQFDDAYSMAVINKSINNLTLTAQYAMANDVWRSATSNGDLGLYYTEANYLIPMSGFKLGFDAVFRGSKVSNATQAFENLNIEGTYTGVRASISELAGFGFSAAAGTTSSETAVISIGNGGTTYTTIIMAGSTPLIVGNTDSYLFAATYDFSKIGLTGLTSLFQYGIIKQGQYTTGNVVQGANDHKQFACALTYAVPAVKGLTTYVEYMTDTTKYTHPTTSTLNTEKENGSLWFRAGYKF